MRSLRVRSPVHSCSPPTFFSLPRCSTRLSRRALFGGACATTAVSSSSSNSSTWIYWKAILSVYSVYCDVVENNLELIVRNTRMLWENESRLWFFIQSSVSLSSNRRVSRAEKPVRLDSRARYIYMSHQKKRRKTERTILACSVYLGPRERLLCSLSLSFVLFSLAQKSNIAVALYISADFLALAHISLEWERERESSSALESINSPVYTRSDGAYFFYARFIFAADSEPLYRRTCLYACISLLITCGRWDTCYWMREKNNCGRTRWWWF